MKNYGGLFILLLVAGLGCWFGLPWWAFAVAAVIGGFIFKNNVWGVFFLAFSAGTAIWSGFATWQNMANAGILAGRIGTLLKGLSAAQLIWATGAIGGALAALGALTGNYARAIFIPEKKKGYFERRRK